MRIVACCSTYLRARQLGWVVAMFCRQTHEDRRLLIFDDAGHLSGFDGVPEQEKDRIILVSQGKRCASLGDKRNECHRLAVEHFGTFDACCPVDDDDIYLDWHLEAMAKALEQAEWSLPSRVLHLNKDGSFRQHLTGPGTFYHGGMGWRREVFERCGGYPAGTNWAEDQGLFRRLEAIGATTADPVVIDGRPPAYCWCGDITQEVPHASSVFEKADKGKLGWDWLGRLRGQRAAPSRIVVKLPSFLDLDNPRISETVLPRAF